MGDFFFQTEKADFSTNSLITMRESTNESSRNKATITFNHSLRIVVADFLVNKPLTLEQLDRLFFCLLTEALITLNSRTNMHYVSFNQSCNSWNETSGCKIRTPLTGLCPNDTRLVEFIYSDCAKSAVCHLEVNTPVPPHSVPNVWRAVA